MLRLGRGLVFLRADRMPEIGVDSAGLLRAGSHELHCKAPDLDQLGCEWLGAFLLLYSRHQE